MLVMLGAYIVYSRTGSFANLGIFAIAAIFIKTTMQLPSGPFSAEEALIAMAIDSVLVVLWTAAGYGFFVLKQRFSPLIPRDEVDERAGERQQVPNPRE